MAVRLAVALVCAFCAVADGVSGRAIFASAQPQPPQTLRRGLPMEVPAAIVEVLAREGTVRVIIGLAGDFVPEGLLQAADRLQQRTRLAEAQDAVELALTAFQTRDVKRFHVIPAMAALLDGAALAALARRPDVAYIELDALAAPTLVESTAIIGAPAAWASGVTGAGQTIAVLDTGVDRSHPFLAGRVVSEACYSTTQTDVSQSVCLSQTGLNSATPCALPACAHGTHVAGIAVGSGISLKGVAPAANVIAVQVFSQFSREAECGRGRAPCVLTYTSDQLLGLQYVYDLRTTFAIAAANMSIGGGRYTSPAECDNANASRKGAIDALRSAGIATVIASGNDGYVDALSAPACISSAISVGSTTDGSVDATPADQVSSFTNSASFLAMLAPGHWIESSVPGGGFSVFRGTSMAAPHVAGAWALLKSQAPAATVTQLLGTLVSTGTGVFDQGNGFTKPRIDVQAALASLAPTCTYELPTVFTGVHPLGGTGTIDVTSQAGCAWSAVSHASFIAITAGASGQGSGSVTFTVDANPTAAPRTGTITVAARTVTVTQLGLAPRRMHDLNADGRLDLLWQHQGDGRISAWLMNGLHLLEGALLSPSSQVSDTTWKIAGTGDLDGDGHVDLVWQNIADGRVSAWLMTGLTRREGTLLSVPQVNDLQWRIRSVGDLDGDGRADLLWQHEGNGGIAVWWMNGLNVIEGTLLNPSQVTDLSWKIVGTADFDGDGRRDLVWHHQEDGRIAVWFMNGTSLLAGTLTSPGQVPDLNWKIRGVGDLDGDGHPDLLWQHVADGQVAVWLMHGLSLIDGRLLNPPQVADTSWHIVGPR